MDYHPPPFFVGSIRCQYSLRRRRESSRKGLIGEVAERSKALDWNSSNILTGIRGFESHPLRHYAIRVSGRPNSAYCRKKRRGFEPTNPRTIEKRVRQNRRERFWTTRSVGPEGAAATMADAIPPSPPINGYAAFDSFRFLRATPLVPFCVPAGSRERRSAVPSLGSCPGARG